MLLCDIVSYLQKEGVEVELIGSEEGVDILQVAALNCANATQISFLNDKKYLSNLKETHAGAVILKRDYQSQCPVPMLLVDNPYYVYALVAQLLNPVQFSYQVHPDSSIDPLANIAQNVGVMAQAVIAEGASIDEGTSIGRGAVIEENVSIGKNCLIGANVVIRHGCLIGDEVIIEAGSVIGGDGFGWANHNGEWIKIPQIGRVVIGCRVSIGNNVCIDRGAIDDTVIEDNCIIDNMVHIAHNVHIGQGSAIAGQTGFAGSTILGKNCTVAGQVGFSGHITIGDGVHFLAKSGVTHNIETPGTYSGFPAIPVSEWQKNSIRARNLDKMAKQIKQLQKQLDALGTSE